MGSVAPEVNYFTCTLGQAAGLEGDSDHFKTIPQFLDYQARNFPDLPALAFPVVKDGEWQAKVVSFERLRRGSSLASNLLEMELKERPSRCVALLGPSSIDFLFAWFGLMNLGCSVLLIAPQCQPAAIAHLCTACDVSILFYDKTYQELATTSSSADFSSKLLPWQNQDRSLSSFLEKATPASKNQFKINPNNENDTAYIHHTSGTSTGLPKPIPQSHRAGLGVLPRLNGKDSATFTTTPLYHGGIADCFRAWKSNALIWLFPGVEVPITSTNIRKCLQTANRYHQDKSTIPKVKYFSSVPYVLQLLSEDTEGLSWLRQMEVVGVGGAALPKSIGDKLVSEGVNLISRFGSAECGFLLSSHRAFDCDEEWQYLRLPPGSKYLEFEEQEGENGLYELVVKKGWPHMAKKNREDGSLGTSDLFEKHPTIENAWRYHSRSDSQITLVTGRKFDPASIEDALMAQGVGLIQDAFIFGSGRQFPGVIVILGEKSIGMELEEVEERVWKELERVDEGVQEWMRVGRDMIVLLDPSTEPLQRSSKGTLLRGVVEKRFEKVIEGAYASGDGEENEGMGIGNKDVLGVVRDVVKSIIRDGGFDDDMDFYQGGVDSAKGTKIRGLLIKRLGMTKMAVPWNVVYDCGNIVRLSQVMIGLRSGNRLEEKNEVQEMMRLVDSYSSFDVKPRQNEGWSQVGDDLMNLIILTGATGALGAFILDHLRATTSSVILCLVRADHEREAIDRVDKSLATRRKQGLEFEGGTRIRCEAAKLGEKGLGLRPIVLQAVSRSRLTIIHAAWAVNFSLPLRSFVEDHIAGIQNLIQLCFSCDEPGKFIFCSSTASILGNTPDNPILERFSRNPDEADKLGYSRSKWVAEGICERASNLKEMKGKIAVLRIGQLTGDTENGVWNMTEAWPLMLSSVFELGCLPSLKEKLEWLPLDLAAKAVVEIGLEGKLGLGGGDPVYHLVGKGGTFTWNAFLQSIRTGPGALDDFDTVPVTVWLDKLEELEGEHPAKALLGLWKKAYCGNGSEESGDGDVDVVKIFETKKAEDSASILADFKGVDEALVNKIWTWIVREREKRPAARLDWESIN